MLKAKSGKQKAIKNKVCNSKRDELYCVIPDHCEGEFANISCFKFRRSKKYISILCFTALVFLLSAVISCSFNPNLQGKGEVYLQGEWQQDSNIVERKLVVASQYDVKFDCDSFFIQIKDHSKVKYGSDTCRNSGHWAEYIKGTYSQKIDTLFLKGQYCNANFTLKTNTDCFSTGPYQEFFKVIKQTDSFIQLSGTSLVIPVNLKLIKKISCTPKSL